MYVVYTCQLKVGNSQKSAREISHLKLPVAHCGLAVGSSRVKVENLQFLIKFELKYDCNEEFVVMIFLSSMNKTAFLN